MGWKCETCGASSEGPLSSDSIEWPIRHEMENPGHQTNPTLATVMAWAKVLGVSDPSVDVTRTVKLAKSRRFEPVGVSR